MNHAEARARLSDLALEPARLRQFDRAGDQDSMDLRGHLAGCAECRAELGAWRSTMAALDAAVGTAPADDLRPAGTLHELASSGGRMTLPAGLRDRTLALARERTVAPAESPSPASPVISIASRRRVRRPVAWLGIAATLVVLVAGAALVVDRTRQLDQSQSEVAALQQVTAGLDRVLQDPSHRVAPLVTVAGATGGSVSWSQAEGYIVVLAGALQVPPAGQTYRCYVTQGGASVAVGEMWFSGSLAYWVGSFDTWGVAAAGSRFSVNLEPTAPDSGGPIGTPVLTGTL
jgi:hypothetical protein